MPKEEMIFGFLAAKLFEIKGQTNIVAEFFKLWAMFVVKENN